MAKKRKPYKTYPKELKIEAVRMMEESNRPAAELAMELGIRRNQLYKWKEQMKISGYLGTISGDTISAYIWEYLEYLGTQYLYPNIWGQNIWGHNTYIQVFMLVFTAVKIYQAQEKRNGQDGKGGGAWNPSSHHAKRKPSSASFFLGYGLSIL